MGQKDITQKTLEGFPDVFADIINALLYQGKTVVSEENLIPYATESVYPAEKHKFNNLFQDISMLEQKNHLPLILYTIENQSSTDYRMTLRNAGYEGAFYRKAYAVKKPYPYIGIVLNWGLRVWKGKTSIHDYFSKNRFSKQMLKYINNLRYPVFDMRHLPFEIRKQFHSDMRIIVDFLAEQDKDKTKDCYTPTHQELKHPEEVLCMLKALTGDRRFVEILKKFRELEEKQPNRKDRITMCILLDSYWNDGVSTGIERGKAEGKLCTLITNIKLLMNKLNLTLAQTMDMLEVDEGDRPVILEHFKQK